MKENFILAWQDGAATVLSNNVFFKSAAKPALSFPFDTLICEAPTDVYFRMVGENQFLLTEEQVEECRQFCQDYYTSGDYSVFAYDPQDGNLYKGNVLKSECQAKGWAYVLDSAPDNLTAAWDESTGSWKNYYAVITENGELVTDVSKLACDTCVLFFTKEEFDALPARPHTTDTWDFVTESWADKRDLAKLKTDTLRTLRSQFEKLRRQAVPSSASVLPYEQDTWRIQLAEAEAYQAHGEDAHTPYIDAFLAAREDSAPPSKADFVADIIANHTSYVSAMASINAKQWSFMKAVEKAENGYAVDTLKEESIAYVKEKTADAEL